MINKLKRKIFSAIMLIITIFFLGVIIVINVVGINNTEKEYGRYLNVAVNNVLDYRFDNNIHNGMIKPDKDIVFYNSDIYIIKLDNNEFDSIIYYSSEKINNDIEKVSKNILNRSNMSGKFGNYYYQYKTDANNKYLVLMDINYQNKKIRNDILVSIIIFIIGELLVCMAVNRLVLWIIKPVEENFKRQKEFVSDASHELKTPLAVIQANVEMIDRNKKNEKWIDYINDEVNKMNGLIKSLLTLTKMEELDDSVVYNDIDLSKVINKAVLPFESILFENNIEVKQYIDDDIHFKCNEDNINQLIGILLDNAIKHIDGKKIIEVNLFKEKNNIIIEVKNTGKPIEESDRDKIFERFYRSDKSRNRSQNRYGLGLAIAKSIVLKYKGNISVDCFDGWTRFLVKF